MLKISINLTKKTSRFSILISKQSIITKSTILNNLINTITTHFETFNYKRIFDKVYSCKFNKRILTLSSSFKKIVSSFSIYIIIIETNRLSSTFFITNTIIILKVNFKFTKYTSIFCFTL